MSEDNTTIAINGGEPVSLDAFRRAVGQVAAGRATLNITRVKYAGGGCEIRWQTRPRDGETIVHELASDEPPEPEFVAALAALARPVCRVLDLPETYEEGLVPQTVTVKYADEGWGVIITSLKKVSGLNAPLVLNTPYMAERGEQTAEIPGYLARAVDAVLWRAERYVQGHREQANLFQDEVDHA